MLTINQPVGLQKVNVKRAPSYSCPVLHQRPTPLHSSGPFAGRRGVSAPIPAAPGAPQGPGSRRFFPVLTSLSPCGAGSGRRWRARGGPGGADSAPWRTQRGSKVWAGAAGGGSGIGSGVPSQMENGQKGKETVYGRAPNFRTRPLAEPAQPLRAGGRRRGARGRRRRRWGGQTAGPGRGVGPVAPGGGSVPAESRGLRAPAEQSRAAPYSRCRRRRRAGTGERRAAPRPAGSMSGGRSGRAAVKMEAPFYPEEGLELLPDFVPLPGFAAAAGPGAEAAAAAGPKLLLGAGKKRQTF